MASHTHAHVHTKWELKTKTHTERHTRTHSHTLEPSGSAMETMHAAEGTETVSLCESCNLLTEGHILCWPRERASNTASFLMPSGCVVRACLCVRACWQSLRVREKKEADSHRSGGIHFRRNDDELAEECSGMHVQAGGDARGPKEPGCLTRAARQWQASQARGANSVACVYITSAAISPRMPPEIKPTLCMKLMRVPFPPPHPPFVHQGDLKRGQRGLIQFHCLSVHSASLK